MENLKSRTKKFALDVLQLCARLPHKTEFQILSRQLMRSATSVAANYRTACRGKSKADFICKLSTVEEEADESTFWLEMIRDIHSGEHPGLARLQNEASQLVAIVVTSKKTA